MESKNNYKYIVINIPTVNFENRLYTTNKLVKIIRMLYKNNILIWNFNENTNVDNWVRLSLIDLDEDRYIIDEMNIKNTDDIAFFEKYPVYIYINLYINDLWYDYDYDYQREDDPHVYSNVDIRDFKSIIETGKIPIKPDYSPRKYRV